MCEWVKSGARLWIPSRLECYHPKCMVSSKLATARYFGVASLLFIGFCISANAANPQSTARERETAAEKFVAQKVQLWQERLNLKDWNISFALVHPDKLEPKTLGNIKWDSPLKTATIPVLSP